LKFPCERTSGHFRSFRVGQKRKKKNNTNPWAKYFWHSYTARTAYIYIYTIIIWTFVTWSQNRFLHYTPYVWLVRLGVIYIYYIHSQFTSTENRFRVANSCVLSTKASQKRTHARKENTTVYYNWRGKNVGKVLLLFIVTSIIDVKFYPRCTWDLKLRVNFLKANIFEKLFCFAL